MVKHLHFKFMLLLCALIAGNGSVWAGNEIISIGKNPSGSSATSYVTTIQEFTIGGVTFKMCNYNPSSGQIRGNDSSPSNNFYLYNTTAIPGTLKSIKLIANIVDSKTYLRTGNDAITSISASGTNPSSSTWNGLSGTFFCISMAKGGTSGTVKMEGVTIEYEPGLIDLPSFAFGNNSPSIDLSKGNGSFDALFTQTISSLPDNYSGTVTYEIDYGNSTITEDEAAINSYTGEVTILRENNTGGSLVIVASGEATDKYNKPDDATYTLTVNPYKPAAPTISPTGGSVVYGTPLALSAAEGTSIRYLLNGTNPTVSTGEVYSSELAIKDAWNLRAIAVDGSYISDVASADYTISTIDNVTLTPAGGNSSNKTAVQYGTQVTMTHPLSSLGNIRYTTNGRIPANLTGDDIATMMKTYSTPITITEDCRIKPQFQTDNGLYWSASAPDNYYVVATPDAPTASVASGTEVVKNSTVTLSHALLEGSLGKIYYTTDGTDPTTSSTEYSAAITIDADKTIKAIFVTNGGHTSEVATFEYTYIREDAGLAYAKTSFTTAVNSTFTKPALTNPNSLTVAYESSDASIASVDSETGDVTIKDKEGDVTIYARSAKDATYYAGEASYTITVYDPDHKGSQWNPYTVAEALEAIEALGSGNDTGTDFYYVNGIVSSNVGSISSGKLSFRISAYGSNNEDELFVYQFKYLENANFTSSNKVQVGDEVTLVGQLENYSGTPYINDGYLTYFKRRLAANLAFGGESAKTVTLTKGVELTGVAFTKADGIDIADVTFTSSYNNVASVSSTGVISLGGSTGTAIITATFEKNDDFNAGKATCTITVNPAGVTPEPSATGKYVRINTSEALTDGNYLIVNEASNIAMSNAVDANNNKISVTISSNEITATDATNAAAFTITKSGTVYYIKGANGKYIGSSSTSNALTASESALDNTIEFSGNNATIKGTGGTSLQVNGGTRFRYYASSQSPIQLYKFVVGESPTNITIAISEAGLATYASNFALDYTDVSGLEAYIAIDNNGAVTLTKVNKVPAETGVLLRSTNGGTLFNVPTTTETTDNVDGNLFKRGTGAAVASEADGKYNYILNVVDNKIGFYKANGMTVATNRAYLQTTSSAARIAIDFEEASGITSAEDRECCLSDAVYTLDGRKVTVLDKQDSLQGLKTGLYIVGGRKVVVK